MIEKHKDEEYYHVNLKKIFRIILLSFIFVFLFVVLVAYYNIQNINVIKSRSYVMKGEIIKTNHTNITKVGISADVDKLDFGRAVFNETNSIKILDVHNPTNRTIVSYFIARGNITQLLNYSNSTVVYPHTTKEVYIKMVSREVGNFSGEMKIINLYPNTELSEKLMLWLYKKKLIHYLFPSIFN